MAWQHKEGYVPDTVHNPFLQFVQTVLLIGGLIAFLIAVGLYNSGDVADKGRAVMFGLGAFSAFGLGLKVKPTRHNTRRYR
ncbi:MAG: hypothetical protein ACFB6R_04375 [Alphaproteobacteria bacterium]